MDPMNASPVTPMSDRRRRMARAVAARRRLDRAPFPAGRPQRSGRTGGRAWLNGTELGGTDPRHATLALSYD
jgi:hypothetical protein